MKKIKSYGNTRVHWGKSQADISKLLTGYGVKDTRFTFLDSRQEIICEFNYETKISAYGVESEQGMNVGVRIITPIPESRDDEQAKNQAYRVLFYSLKSKFITVTIGQREFVKEFMADLVVFDKKGNSQTMFQAVMPQYVKGIVSGQQGEIKMIEEPK